MRLTILGMNGPFPAPSSACSGYLVESGSTTIQMDIGTGTLSALTGWMAPESLDALLLSHWHFDHCSDLLPLIFRLQACAKKPLELYAPMDESSAIRKIAMEAGCFQVHTITPGDSFTVGSVRCQVFAARHPVPAVMYRLSDSRSTLAFTGDTNTMPNLSALANHADLLLADGLFPVSAWTEGKPHLSARQCAELARDAHAKQLIITHLNPQFDPETLLREAREVYPQVSLAACGKRYEL